MKHLLGKLLPFLFLIVIVVALAATTPGFMKPNNVANVLRFSSVIVIMGVGMTFVIISAGIDLSVGSVVAFTSVIVAWCMHSGIPLPLSLLIGILTGSAWGLVNGSLIILLQLPPFVATLASMGMARGSAILLARWISGFGTSIEIPADSFAILGSGKLFRLLPVPVVILFVVVVVGHYMLNHTRLGRYTFAIGSNVEAARYSGIPVKRYTLMVYVLLGTLAGLAGMIEASINRGGHATLGNGYELQVIAAVVIGGGSLSGGAGTILGTLSGALIMGVIRNGCILNNLDYEWQLVVISVLIVIAVAFDTYRRRRTGT
jgi:ribose transport system permease protein